MRAVECIVQGCGHVHAETEGRLVQEVLNHARAVHPDLGLTQSKVENFVEQNSYVDTKHGPNKMGLSGFIGRVGSGFDLPRQED